MTFGKIEFNSLFVKSLGAALLAAFLTLLAAVFLFFTLHSCLLIVPTLIMMMATINLLVIKKWIIRPVAVLVQAALAMNKGDLTRRVPVTSQDEIGQLATAFNGMTDRLKGFYENREHLVFERTKELVQANQILHVEFEQRELMHEALLASEERSRSIIETANDAFVSINEEGMVIDWNRRAEIVFGWSRREVIGKPMTALIVPEAYRETHDRTMNHFLKTGEGPILGKTRETTALHRNGHEFAIELTVWSIEISQKYQFNAFIRDITDRKKTEEQLRAAYADVEEKEKSLRHAFTDLQSTHENLKKTQNQLLQSEKLASIGQLAAGVAHEINNPVGFISNNVEVLGQYVADYTTILRMNERLRKSIEGGRIDEAQAVAAEMSRFEGEINLGYVLGDTDKLLQFTRKGIERIQKIVNDLRTFARENSEDMEIVKIEEVIDSILSIVHNELKYKAELKKDYGTTSLLKCNPQRLGQVFINLFMNASQAITEKGVIGIKTYEQGGYVCVDVSDTGKGIPAENIKRIFDPFYTTKPVGQGTGLGLSVSYEIIKKHLGEIRVRSEVGQGTTFTVMLPVADRPM